MKEIKTFNVRLRKDLWMFLKKEAANRETSMTGIIQTCVIKFKKRCEKKELTVNDTNV